MEIAIVGDYPLDKQKIGGGVQGVMVNFVDCLSRACDEITIHVVSPQRGIKGNLSFTEGNVHYHFVPRFIPYELSVILGVNKRRILKQLLNIKPAVVHIQNYEYSYLCKNAPYPTFVTPHGMPRMEARYMYGKLAKLRTRLQGVIADWFISRYAKHLILISEYSKSMTKISKQANVFYVAYPVKSHFFHARNREIKDRLLFVAADITPRKNPLLILKTVAALKRNFPQISLHIAGYFSNAEFHNALKQFIRENQIEENIRFMGRLTVDGLVKAFEECSVFVLTSEWENLPAVVAQAMASGKPVIATRLGGVPEMMQDGITGLLITPGDGDALTRGIEKLLRDGELRSTMGRTAREETFKKFSEEAVARKTLEAYQTVLNQ